MSLTTTQVTGAAYANTSGDPATFVVPGNATPKWDGAPVYGSVESAAQGIDPVTTLPMSTTVRIESQEWWRALDGSPIFRVHTDGGVEGWMTGSTLTPRDSVAPKVWGTDEGIGLFSPNGDGRQDDWHLGVELSEPSSWTLRILDGDGHVLDHKSGSGDTAGMTWAPDAGSVDDGTYTWQIEATDGWGNGPTVEEGSVRVDTTAPDLALADAEADSTPSFAPNGDGYRETFAVAGTASESGSLVATVLDDTDNDVDSFTAALSGGAATLTLGRQGRRRLRPRRPVHDPRPRPRPRRQPVRPADPHGGRVRRPRVRQVLALRVLPAGRGHARPDHDLLDDARLARQRVTGR